MNANQYLCFIGISVGFWSCSALAMESVSVSSPSGLASLHESQWKLFSDLYSEEMGLARAETVSGYLQLRGGWSTKSHLETYAVMRLGADTRTTIGSSNAVYNDNYVFLGAGLDYLGLLPGVRLTAQIGESIDLTSKTQRGGFDFKTGYMTYHEVRFPFSRFNMEFYSDGFYIHRYKNVLITGQMRMLYDLFKVQVFQSRAETGSGFVTFSPMITLAPSLDTAGFDYNRFLEGRFGFRIKTATPVSVLLNPYFAYGLRYQYPTEYPNYTDFRVLLALYAAF